MTQHDDLAYLGQMLDAAVEARSYVAGIGYDAFQSDRMRQRAVIYVIQIIGEAAKGVSSERRQAMGDIPWSKVIGMRNNLVHDYLGVDVEEVWRTANKDVTQLIDILERALST